MEYFNPISAVIEGTGAMFNSSKKHFVWRFELDQEEHTVELECSFLTNKRRVTFDGNLIFKGTKPLLSSDFQYQFKHKVHIITVYNHRSDANLLVDSLSFDVLYTKKILNRVQSFTSKNPSKTEHKVDPIPPLNPFEPSTNEIKGPKPARFMTDEEYEKALSVSKGFQTEPKKSLRDILEKNNEKIAKNQNFDLLSLGNEGKSGKNLVGDGALSDRTGKKGFNEDFLDIGEGKEEKNERIESGWKRKGKDLDDILGFGFEKTKGFYEGFLEVESNKGFKGMGNDFLNFEPRVNKEVDKDFFGIGLRSGNPIADEGFLSLDRNVYSESSLVPESVFQKDVRPVVAELDDFLSLDPSKSQYQNDKGSTPNLLSLSPKFIKSQSPQGNHPNPNISSKHAESNPPPYQGIDIFSVYPSVQTPSPFAAPTHLSLSQSKQNKDFESLFS